MESVLSDMLRWSLGFVLVAMAYLALGLWLLGRMRKGGTPKGPATPETDRSTSHSAAAGNAEPLNAATRDRG